MCLSSDDGNIVRSGSDRNNDRRRTIVDCCRRFVFDNRRYITRSILSIAINNMIGTTQ